MAQRRRPLHQPTRPDLTWDVLEDRSVPALLGLATAASAVDALLDATSVRIAATDSIAVAVETPVISVDATVPVSTYVDTTAAAVDVGFNSPILGSTGLEVGVEIPLPVDVEVEIPPIVDVDLGETGPDNGDTGSTTPTDPPEDSSGTPPTRNPILDLDLSPILPPLTTIIPKVTVEVSVPPIIPVPTDSTPADPTPADPGPADPTPLPNGSGSQAPPSDTAAPSDPTPTTPTSGITPSIPNIAVPPIPTTKGTTPATTTPSDPKAGTTIVKVPTDATTSPGDLEPDPSRDSATPVVAPVADAGAARASTSSSGLIVGSTAAVPWSPALIWTSVEGRDFATTGAVGSALSAQGASGLGASISLATAPGLADLIPSSPGVEAVRAGVRVALAEITAPVVATALEPFAFNLDSTFQMIRAAIDANPGVSDDLSGLIRDLNGLLAEIRGESVGRLVEMAAFSPWTWVALGAVVVVSAELMRRELRNAAEARPLVGEPDLLAPWGFPR